MTLIISVNQIVESSKNPLLKTHATWGRVELSLIADVLNGFAFDSKKFSKSGEIPLIRIRDLGYDQTDCKYSGEFDLNYLVKSGDLLIGMDGDFKSSRWRGSDALLNQRVCKIIQKTEFYSPKFLDYVLPAYLLEINKMTSSLTVKHLSSQTIKEIPLPLPPLTEQDRLVTKIEELFTQLDAGVISLKKVQAQLKRYRQAVLKAAFEGKLTQKWREENKGEIAPASILFERIKSKYDRDEKEIAKRLPLNESDLFQVPNEWIWVQVQDVCENITNGYTPSAEKLFEGSGEIPFIKVYNLTKTGAFDFTKKPTFISRVTHETELRRSAVYPNDVLMNIVGPPLGKISLVPELHDEWNINQAIVIYRTFPEYSRKLILYALLSETIQKWLQKRGKTTAGQTNYTITMSRSLPIPLPPLNEQSIIVNEIERHFSQIDHIERIVETSLRQANSLRQSILKRAFEGKLVSQDPTDEPASILLEKIKAEKALQPISQKRKTKNGN